VEPPNTPLQPIRFQQLAKPPKFLDPGSTVPQCTESQFCARRPASHKPSPVNPLPKFVARKENSPEMEEKLAQPMQIESFQPLLGKFKVHSSQPAQSRHN
jgi:hypothetical protein